MTGLRSGDAVRVGDRGPVRDVTGLEVGDGGIAVTLDDGSVHHPRELVPVGYACPVCGHFEPPLEPVRRRPCTACLRELSRLDQSDTGVDRALGSVLARAEDAIKHARGLEGAPVMELARERAGLGAAAAPAAARGAPGRPAGRVRACLRALGRHARPAAG